ncbi:ectD [Symbiodinium natans]|uniref:EctD protein n=1 Tax=Symbiodinium natans TaxID=878477 RepID=A0A812PZV7_9DINO|nr:ectD [Symbiodinium natans]
MTDSPVRRCSHDCLESRALGDKSKYVCCAQHAAARRDFDVTLVDAKDFFEFTPGILRAFVQPSHFEALSFHLAPVLSKIGVRFVTGEVKKLDYDGQQVLAEVKALEGGEALHLTPGSGLQAEPRAAEDI